MGTENILFLDLVVVSRGTIIPESSLSCALITCEHVFHFFFFFTFVGLKIHVLSKNVEELVMAVSVNVSYLLSVSVKEGS